MKKTFLLLVAILLIHTLTYAQSNYKPGIIITNQNETIRGFIDYRTDDMNARQCRFKKEESSPEKIYHPGDISTYKFDDGKYYVSRNVEIDSIQTEVFLEFLVEGVINLYYCKHNGQAYYFFEDENGKMVSYTQKPEKLNDKGYYTKDYRYKGLIRYYFQENQSIARQADKMKFDQKSFINIAKKYHDDVCTTGEECIVYVNKKPDEKSVKFLYSVFTGIQQSTYIFDINDKSSYTSKSISPVIGVQVNMINPRWSKSFAVHLEVAFSQFKNKTDRIPDKEISSGYYYVFDYKALSLSPKIGIQYIYPKYRLRPTIGAGIIYTMLLSPSCDRYIVYKSGNSTNASNYKLRKNHPGYYINIGAEYSLKNNGAVFMRVAMENYLKGDKMQFNGNDKIKTPNLILGYTF